MIADATKNWSWTKYSESTAFDAYAVEIANDNTDKGNYYFKVRYKELMETTGLLLVHAGQDNSCRRKESI